MHLVELLEMGSFPTMPFGHALQMVAQNNQVDQGTGFCARSQGVADHRPAADCQQPRVLKGEEGCWSVRVE